MTPENFVYWLQGFFELSKAEAMNAEQVAEIKNHLALALLKVTPSIPTVPYIPALDRRPFGPPYEITCKSLEATCVADSSVLAIC